MHKWLTVIIVLLILGVILDGVRRMRLARRSSLRMSSRMPQGKDPEGREAYGSELPNGGARVVNVRKSDDARQLYEKMRESREEKKRRIGRPNRIPEQVALNLDEQVPMLMEVEGQQAESRSSESSPAPDQQEEARDDFDDFADEGRIEPRFSDPDDPVSEAAGPDAADDAQAVDEEANSTPDRPLPGDNAPDRFHHEDLGDDDIGSENLPQAEQGAEESMEYDDAEAEEEYREPEDVLVINVMAPKGRYFPGDALLETVLERGMRFGSMDIFHHHAGANGKGSILYSMANIVVPGTFDLANMEDFTTPGVSLFLALPVDADSGQAFEHMLATADAIARNLNGELKDEHRSVLTAQTVEHYRSRIKEFERKRLSRAPA